MQNLLVKVEDLESRLVPTTPQTVYDDWHKEAERVVELMQLAIPQFDTVLQEGVQTWSDLEMDEDKVEIQTRLEEL